MSSNFWVIFDLFKIWRLLLVRDAFAEFFFNLWMPECSCFWKLRNCCCSKAKLFVETFATIVAISQHIFFARFLPNCSFIHLHVWGKKLFLRLFTRVSAANGNWRFDRRHQVHGTKSKSWQSNIVQVRKHFLQPRFLVLRWSHMHSFPFKY